MVKKGPGLSAPGSIIDKAPSLETKGENKERAAAKRLPASRCSAQPQSGSTVPACSQSRACAHSAGRGSLWPPRRSVQQSFFANRKQCVCPIRFRKGIDPVCRIPPHMPLHHLSAHTRPKAFRQPCTPLARHVFAAILPVPFARRGLPSEPLFLWVDVFVAFRVIAEAVLPIVLPFVRVPPVSDHPLYTLPLQQMRYPRVAGSG